MNAARLNVRAELEAAGGAILVWQVSNPEAFADALARGEIARDDVLDLYHLPECDLSAERAAAAADDEGGAP